MLVEDKDWFFTLGLYVTIQKRIFNIFSPATLEFAKCSSRASGFFKYFFMCCEWEEINVTVRERERECVCERARAIRESERDKRECESRDIEEEQV